MEDRSLISVVIPCCNEEGNVPRVHQALVGVFAPLASRYDAEFLFIDDGSTDGTAATVEKMAKSDPRIKLISFSRNFGKDIAMTAGIHNARGAAIIMLDADLRHPPELVPLFLEKWQSGAEVVIGIRKKNKKDSLAKRCGLAVYCKLINMIFGTAIVPRETDFRLIDRAVADVFNTFKERQRNAGALIDWLGFKREYVEFDMDESMNGGAAYSPRKLFHLATYSFASHSLFPLRIMEYFGTFIAFCSGLFGITVFFEQYVFHGAWGWNISGASYLAIINAFLVGIVLFCLGSITLRYKEYMDRNNQTRRGAIQ
jgi:dolichol-phosphate mannosyltransferase